MKPPPTVVEFNFGKTAAETVAVTRTIKNQLANHPNQNVREPYPFWLSSLDVLGGDADRLETAAQLAVNRDLLMVKEMDAQQAGLQKKLMRLAQYVELAVDGNRADVKAAGFGVRPLPQGKHAKDPLLVPELVVGHAEESGAVKAKATYDRRAKSFRMQLAELDPSVEASWRDIDDFPLSKIIIRGLEPGKLYWFRVSVLTSAGRTPWSKPVCIRCL